ncbi:uncharacterized protein LOC142981615 isoform X1 [Anticarsia gemmatalis]|uniref:uncharacterized protein LOC142981615 isoform X1 n=1 Tax=Anticarsia gemmatalis TaxID=129554 RepID=UPI003F75E22C
MEAKKRKRSSNFTNAEIQLLLSLVEKFKLSVENKKTDAVSNKEKESAWLKIGILFNSCTVATSIRSWKTLKLKYESLKKQIRKKSILQTQTVGITGGGPSDASELTHVEEKMLDVFSDLQRAESRRDSDAVSVPLSNEVILLDEDQKENLLVADAEGEKEVQNHRSSIIQDDFELPESDESVIFEMDEKDVNVIGKENKLNQNNSTVLTTRVSNMLQLDTAKENVADKMVAGLDKPNTDQQELVKLQVKIAERHLQYMEEEHKLKMIHLLNDERRKQELHELISLKIQSSPDWSC